MLRKALDRGISLHGGSFMSEGHLGTLNDGGEL